MSSPLPHPYYPSLLFPAVQISSPHAELLDVGRFVYSPLKSSIQLKSIPPSCSKGEKKNVVLPGTIIGREPTPKFVCVGAGPSIENIQFFGQPMP